jgi:hypothetical protein
LLGPPTRAFAVSAAWHPGNGIYLPSRGFNWYFFSPRPLALRLLLHPRPAALNQNNQNYDRYSSGNNSENRRLIHAVFLSLPQLFGQ